MRLSVFLTLFSKWLVAFSPSTSINCCKPYNGGQTDFIIRRQSMDIKEIATQHTLTGQTVTGLFVEFIGWT